MHVRFSRYACNINGIFLSISLLEIIMNSDTNTPVNLDSHLVSTGDFLKLQKGPVILNILPRTLRSSHLLNCNFDVLKDHSISIKAVYCEIPLKVYLYESLYS